jgi:hypothetical protein
MGNSCGKCNSTYNILGSFWNTVETRYSLYNTKLGISSNLTRDYLYSLYHKQNKRCFLSNRPITLPTNGFEYWRFNKIPQLYAIDPFKGYVKGNVSWVLNPNYVVSKSRSTSPTLIKLTSKYNGVKYNCVTNTWVAYVYCKKTGREQYVGTFNTELEAAIAFNMKTVEYVATGLTTREQLERINIIEGVNKCK